MLVALAGALALSGLWASSAQASDPLAYVANESAGTISPVDLTTGTLGTPISVGSQPDAIAITPNGSTAYVADHGSSKIVPVNLSTGTAGTPIALHDPPTSIAITPDGAPPTSSPTPAPPGRSRSPPGTLALARASDQLRRDRDHVHSGRLDGLRDQRRRRDDIAAGVARQQEAAAGDQHCSPTPDAIAITPDGSTAYVASNIDGTITPIDLATWHRRDRDHGGHAAQRDRDHAGWLTAYVTDYGSSSVTPITLATGTAGTPLSLGFQPSAIALVPAGGVTSGSGGGSVQVATARDPAPPARRRPRSATRS